MRTSALITWLATGTLLVTGCQPPAPKFTPQDEAAVHALFDSAAAKINSGRWDDWAQQWAENGVIQPPNAAAVSGRTALAAWGKTFPAGSNVTFTDVRVTGEGNQAYATSGFVLSMPGMPTDTGKQLVTFHRTASGTWEGTAGNFNSNRALPAMPAAPARH